jgi:hypothetical protein
MCLKGLSPCPQGNPGWPTFASRAARLRPGFWSIQDPGRILGVMRVVKVDPAVLADCMYLIGRAWLERGVGDTEGAAASLAAAMVLVPPEAVQAILFMIETGELPEPGPGPEAMDAWLEQCRQAGAGDLRLTLGYVPAAPPPDQPESEAEFLMRLARRVHGDNAPAPDPPAPVSLSDELRAMGLM